MAFDLVYSLFNLIGILQSANRTFNNVGNKGDIGTFINSKTSNYVCPCNIRSTTHIKEQIKIVIVSSDLTYIIMTSFSTLIS